MSLPSYSDVFAISHERGYDEEILEGDLVRTGPNLFPHYEVLAVRGETAWVRNIESGAEHLTPVTRCRRLLRTPALAVAAE